MGGRIRCGSFYIKLEVIVLFLRVKSDVRATSLSSPYAQYFHKDIQSKFGDTFFFHRS